MQVLIVEDNISTALDIELILKDLGKFSIFLAQSITELENHLTANKFDLILADILMNGKSSLPLLKASSLDTPIIIMTNNYSNEYYEESLALNAHAYLMKPVNPVSLKFEIDRIHQNKVDTSTDAVSKVIIKDGQKINLVSPSEIIWIKTEGNYSTIKTTTKKIVIKKSMARIVDQIDSKTLFRTHRSSIIQLNRIDAIDLKNSTVIMIDGEAIPLSKKFRSELSRVLGDLYKKLI